MRYLINIIIGIVYLAIIAGITGKGINDWEWWAISLFTFIMMIYLELLK